MQHQQTSRSIIVPYVVAVTSPVRRTAREEMPASNSAVQEFEKSVIDIFSSTTVQDWTRTSPKKEGSITPVNKVQPVLLGNVAV